MAEILVRQGNLQGDLQAHDQFEIDPKKLEFEGNLGQAKPDQSHLIPKIIERMNKDVKEHKRQAKQFQDWKVEVGHANKEIADAKAQIQAIAEEIMNETREY